MNKFLAGSFICLTLGAVSGFRAVSSADFSVTCGKRQVSSFCEFVSDQAGDWEFSDWTALGGPTPQILDQAVVKRPMQMGGVLDNGPYTTTVTFTVNGESVVKEVVCSPNHCREK